jgi:RNA polymerase sigma factor (TIGR02999 family)
MEATPSITVLLKSWSSGDKDALERLTPLVYEELHKRARRIFAGERAGHTLQPTALVNEAFAGLVDAEVAWQDRAHFFALAARMMRRILVNHAKARGAQKRGGGAVAITLDEAQMGAEDDAPDLLALNDALEALEKLDARGAELVELQYFAGMSYRDMEVATGLSSSTLDRDLRFARAWLKRWLEER